MQEIISQITSLLEKTRQELFQNSATVQTGDGGVFGDAVKTVEKNNLSNNEASIKARYSNISAVLYKLAMPLLNESAVNVDGQKTKADATKLNFENISEVATKSINDLGDTINATKVTTEKAKLTYAQETFDNVFNRFESIKAEYKEVTRRVKRHVPVIKFKNMYLYISLLLFIGVCEIPLNKVIFQRFGESDSITMIMAGTLAIAVPVLAHFIGQFWRHRGEMKEYGWKAVVLTVIFLLTNTGLGVFRANVLGEITSIGDDIVTNSELYLNISIFTGITTILFLIGVIAAYLRHDPSYSLEHTYAQYKKYEQLMLDANKTLLETRFDVNSNLARIYENTMDVVHEKIEKLLRLKEEPFDTYNKLVAGYESILETARGLEKMIQSHYEYTASSLGIKTSVLDTPFQEVREIVIQ